MNALVASLTSYLKSPRARQAMLATDRAFYSPILEGHHQYDDRPLYLGVEGATISAPHMHAFALQHLASRLVPGAVALDVGSGSGYLVAAMARMVGPHGKVVGVDIKPELITMARDNVEKDAKHTGDTFLTTVTEIHLSNGWDGDAQNAPFDAIHVGAAATSVPKNLVDQLKNGGMMVIPIGPEGGAQVFTCVEKMADGRLKSTSLLGVQYVPLVDSPVHEEKEL